MAISIEEFRKSIDIGLSRELIQKVLTKYENFDFSSVNTNNGSKLREIDLIDKENIKEASSEEFSYFLNKKLKEEYILSRGGYDPRNRSKHRELIKEASENLKKSLYSRPNTLTLSSEIIEDNRQKDKCSHLLTINTDSSSLISIVNSLFSEFTRLDIPFDIEIPRFSVVNSGTTEPILLHVTTMDLEDTIKTIAKLDKVYKDKIKKTNMFCADVQGLFGYDSVLDVNGTRSSDLLGVAIIKAIDKTLVDLGKDITIDDVSIVDYLKNADNKDEARKNVIEKVKVAYPNIIDPVLLNTVKVIKEESLDINPDNVFISEMASSELNVEFGVYEEEITNLNEIEVEKEEVRIDNAIEEAAKTLTKDVKTGVQSIKDLFSDKNIQSEIVFGSIPLEAAVIQEPSDSLKVENPTVTVVEPVKKDEFQELSEPKFDKIDEEVKPVLSAEQSKTEEEFALPGEEQYVSTEMNNETYNTEPISSPQNMETGIKEVITPEPTAELPGETLEPTQDNVIDNIPNTSAQVDVPVAEENVPNTNVSDVQNPEETQIVSKQVLIPEEPVVEDNVPNTSVSDVQIPEEPQIISEQVSVPEEPVIQNDTQAELDKTQILQPVEQSTVTPLSEMNYGVKEVITPQVNPVPEYVPEKVEPVTNPQPEPQTESAVLQNEVDTMLNQFQNAEVDTRTIEIPTDEIKEENDILSAISNSLDVPDSSKLSTEEKIAVVADTFTKPVDPEKQAKIDKYNGIFIDDQILGMKVKDKDNNQVYNEDGTPYTFLDYLEKNDVLNKIQLDSKYYFKDDPSRDYVDGKTFIREYITTNGINGNRSVEDILDWYVRSVTNINDQTKKKGIFGFGKK